MTEINLKEIAEKLDTAWKKTFNQVSPQTEVNEDEICFGNYALVHKDIEVTKVSILGEKTKTVKGLELVIFVERYTPSEPIDVDEVPLSEHEREDDAIIALIEHEAHRRASAILTNIEFEEMAKEHNEKHL